MKKHKVKLSKYTKPYILSIILAPLLMVLEVSMDLMQPSMMSVVIDDGINAPGGCNMNVILFTSLKMIIFALIGLIGGFGCTYFSSKASQNFGADLRLDLFQKIQTFSFSQTDKFSTGSLVTRLTNDVTQLQNLLMMALRMLIRAPMQCIGGIIMALFIDLRFGFILLITLPVMLLIIFLIITKGGPLFSKMQQKLDKLNGIMQENLTGARVVKAYVRENYEITKFQDINHDLTKISLKVMRIMSAMSPIMMLFMYGVLSAVIYVGGLEVDLGQLMPGQITAVITYMMQSLMGMMFMSMMFMMLSRARASSDRIKEVLQTETTMQDGARKLHTKENTGLSITFKNVSFRYPDSSGDPVLSNINLEIHAGQTVAILGSTGSGKSTLVNLIPRFYDATEGEVLIDGINVQEYQLETLRKKIGCVLQQSTLFSGTIMENIKWGNPDGCDKKAMRAAEIAQAATYIQTFSNGYQTMLGQGGLTLSGGRKQRLCIARALMRDPAILIMDDSTSALDMATEAKLRKELLQNMRGMTVIIIAQRISSVQNADKIVVLDNGKICDIGNHETLMKSSEIYQDIYASQIGTGGNQDG